MYILGFSQAVLEMGVTRIDLQGHLAILTQNSKKQRSRSLLMHTEVRSVDVDIKHSCVAGSSQTNRCQGLMPIDLDI